MTKILHLSDLHFGTEVPHLVDAVAAECNNIAPDIVVVSGDITQRATLSQYKSAIRFLKQLKPKVICVPGNHDISLYNLFERFFFTFYKFRKHIARNFATQYISDNLAILGINSVTPYKPMGGYLTDEQLTMVHEFFLTQPSSSTKIVIMHHNLIKSARHHIINDSDKILKLFAESKVNIVLSGHIHIPLLEQLKKDYVQQPLYIITAGTPISTRTIEPNSFNIIDIQPGKFIFTVKNYIDTAFVTAREQPFSL